MHRTIGAAALIKLGTEMVVVLPFLPKPKEIKLGQGYLRTHKNDQLGAVLVVGRIAEQCTEQRNTGKIRNAGVVAVLAVGNQATENDGRSVSGRNIGADVTGGDV